MPSEPILITVKTYPTLSSKYGELVCTAGVRPDGSWVRIYPVPFRFLDYRDRYKKFQWIETSLRRNSQDPRPESFHLVDLNDLRVGQSIGCENGWRRRRELILDQGTVHGRLQPLIAAAHENACSLAVFRPSRVVDFSWEPDESTWDPARIASMRQRQQQGDLFAEDTWPEHLPLMPKVPYNFYYTFEDEQGHRSRLSIIDWETYQLFLNCRKVGGNDADALGKVRHKYLHQFASVDLHLFLGTLKLSHVRKMPNPWVIIGVFPIPHDPRERQPELF